MRIPKRGEKGFTLIELLIVIAILGVLAAIIVPNVIRFLGRGETEAQNTEFNNVIAAVASMMADNSISTLDNPVLATGAAVNDMSAFPDLSVAGTDKLLDPNGNAYTVTTDKDGYLLYSHDIIGDGAQTGLVNYITIATAAYWYTIDAAGTVVQWDSAPLATRTQLNP